MPQDIKVYKFEDFVNYTKNLKILYYTGTTVGIIDQYEEFFVSIISDSKEDEVLKVVKFNSFIEFLNNTLKSCDGWKDLWIRVALYKPHETVTCLRFMITAENYIVIRPKYFNLIEKIDHILADFIKENSFKVLSYKNDINIISPLSRKRTFDPRNPDPNYMFFLNDDEKPYCEV